MRSPIVYPGADELTYEIREIVAVAKKLEQCGVVITWENIGDPVAKGECVPGWIKDIVAGEVRQDASFGYSPTKGLQTARDFITNERRKECGIPLDPEDILFFNGLGDAIANVYTYLNRCARVIGPNPAYPTHSSAEGAHAGGKNLTYRLDPSKGWLPDLADLRNKVQNNPTITGILIINPDNPTGLVYPRETLEEIVAIARTHDLFLISDEIYAHLAYDKSAMIPLYTLLDDVPALVMRGLSKEVPWPGSRCGCIEFYNKRNDAQFARYAKTLVDAKMLEVCSTTLPQQVLPAILGDVRYATHVRERALGYAKKAALAHALLRDIPGITAPEPKGAFYYSVVFKDGALNNTHALPIANTQARALLEPLLPALPPDKRFVYYLMAATGICVVPLSGFNSDLQGFRMTLLEPDEAVFKKTVSAIAENITTYLSG